MPDAQGGTPYDGGRSDIDRQPGSGGLIFQFTLAEALPRLGKLVRVDEARFYLKHVRVIGDSATPYQEVADLDYKTNQNAPPVFFDDAPPGTYSSLESEFGEQQGGGEDDRGYLIKGSVTIGGIPVELEIEDYDATTQISVPLGLKIMDETTVGVSIDLSFLDRIDWSQAPRKDDKIKLTSADDFTLQIRPLIVAGWKLVQ
jgi:hypothetical protein